MITFFESLADGDKDAILITATAYFVLAGVFSLIFSFSIRSWPMVTAGSKSAFEGIIYSAADGI